MVKCHSSSVKIFLTDILIFFTEETILLTVLVFFLGIMNFSIFTSFFFYLYYFFGSVTFTFFSSFFFIFNNFLFYFLFFVNLKICLLGKHLLLGIFFSIFLNTDGLSLGRIKPTSAKLIRFISIRTNKIARLINRISINLEY